MSPKLTGGWWWRQKKTIAIFGYKQRLLSLDMKTKLVQHVERDWMRDWKSVSVWECKSVRVRECESERVTFEHRHENKSCSEQLLFSCLWISMTRVKEWETVRVREWDLVPSFCLTFRHVFIKKSVIWGVFSTWATFNCKSYILVRKVVFITLLKIA